jgi:phosphohistidine phosphatase SixA
MNRIGKTSAAPLAVFALCALAAAPSFGAIYIVRHAEKQVIEKEPNPPLSEAGVRRAKDLAQVLADVDLKSIFVTEYKRTQETAAPVAALKKLTPIEVKALEPEKLAERLKAGRPEEDVLVVGHANFPALLKALGIKEQVVVTEADYDNLMIVDLVGGNAILHRLHYGAASR